MAHDRTKYPIGPLASRVTGDNFAGSAEFETTELWASADVTKDFGGAVLENFVIARKRQNPVRIVAHVDLPACSLEDALSTFETFAKVAKDQFDSAKVG